MQLGIVGLLLKGTVTRNFLKIQTVETDTKLSKIDESEENH